MPQLIIGHTTHDSTTVWVRGDPAKTRVQVDLDDLEGRRVATDRSELAPGQDYTATVRFDTKLRADTPYRVVARFSGRGRSVVCRGSLRTFPKPGEQRAFRFLHGSCNLATARLTSLGGMAVGLLAGAAARRSLQRDPDGWDVRKWPRFFRGYYGRRLGGMMLRFWAKAVPGGVSLATRFELPEPALPSPFSDLVADLENRGPLERPAFMIHAGDQIYFDVDFPNREPTVAEYRRSYRQAWFEDGPTRTLLSSLPHYMILDDHEILDSFGTDPDDRERFHLDPARVAYDEYVHARNPRQGDELYYRFEHGNTRFFVLDTRTERSRERGEFVSPQQLEELEAWLKEDPNALKFVVSSVPFVAQLRAPGLGPDGRRGDGQADKWSGRPWRLQRERILSAIWEYGVERLVFLVGDMHCAYHATMRIGPPRRRLTVHELAGGPIYQLLYARRDDFYARHMDELVPPKAHPRATKEGRLPWSSTLEAFHGAAPSLLEISVTPAQNGSPLEVGWLVRRTRAKAQPDVEPEAPKSTGSASEPAALRGRIRFHRRAAQEAS